MRLKRAGDGQLDDALEEVSDLFGGSLTPRLIDLDQRLRLRPGGARAASS